MKKYWRCIGPIALSALSLFISFFILQPLALKLDLTFNLLSSRGVGKVVFICMVIYQILMFIGLQSEIFLKNFFERNLFFFVKEKWFSKFSSLFLIFFSLHWSILFFLYQVGQIQYRANWGFISGSMIGKTIFGLFVVFMLAWTEELIFRGTIYPYFEQFYRPLPSALATSFIFMIVHDLKNPLSLLTSNWELGLGLFLLGLLLNQTFVITRKLYTGMGIHAGLVFVKVVLRRAPFLSVPDLRQSHLVHALFALVIISLFVKHRKKFLS